jgi:hypothetical protein
VGNPAWWFSSMYRFRLSAQDRRAISGGEC